MTVREAIEGFEIDNALLTGKEDGTVERNIMAIEALKAMDSYRWIPVEERLPETSGTMREDEKLKFGGGTFMRDRVYVEKYKQYGEFIGLGTMYEELRDGVGQYTTLIIKLADGTFVDLLPEEVKAVADYT